MRLNAIIEQDELGYFAQVSELRGCVTQGRTYEEALSNIQEAARHYLASLKAEQLEMIRRRKVTVLPIEVGVDAETAPMTR